MTFQNQSGQGVSAPSGNQKPVDKGCLLPVDTSFIGKFLNIRLQGNWRLLNYYLIGGTGTFTDDNSRDFGLSSVNGKHVK